jgi:MFS family permease
MAPHLSEPAVITKGPAVFRALSHRNYRLFFCGQTVSLIGTWAQQVAVSWLVYRLTQSAFLLGFVGFATRIPTFVLSPVMGVLADRWDRHRVLVITQALSMVQALALAVLVLTGTVAVWHVIVLSLSLGIINSLDIPTRQSFVVEMIDRREDLGNAIALNSSMVNGARLVGPSVAGLLIAAFGEGVCFLINGLSFVAVLFSLLAMKVTPRPAEKRQARLVEGLREGFGYAFGFPPIRSLLLLLALISLMGMPFTVLMPVFAQDILHGGPATLGFLMAAHGVGALFGTLYLASRRNVLGLGRIIAVSCAVFGAGLIAFAYSRVFGLSLVFVALAGLGMLVQTASTNTLLQTLVDEDKRGRIMSLYTMAFMGMVPFGSILAGSLAQTLGAPGTVLAGGIFCILGGIWFGRRLPSLRKMVRPIYVRKGILPDESM